MSDTLDLSFVTVCAVYEDAEEDELKDLIQNSDSLPKPRIFPNEESYISPEELDEYEIVYSDDIPEPPERYMERSAIVSNIFDSEDVYHVHSYLEPEYYSPGLEFHVELLNPLTECELSVATFTYETDKEISDIIESHNLVDIEGDIDTVHVEYKEDGWRVSIMEGADGSIINFSKREESEIAPSEIPNRIEGLESETAEKIGEIGV